MPKRRSDLGFRCHAAGALLMAPATIVGGAVVAVGVQGMEAACRISADDADAVTDLPAVVGILHDGVALGPDLHLWRSKDAG